MELENGIDDDNLKHIGEEEEDLDILNDYPGGLDDLDYPDDLNDLDDLDDLDDDLEEPFGDAFYEDEEYGIPDDDDDFDDLYDLTINTEELNI
jgi:hypothetical protein